MITDSTQLCFRIPSASRESESEISSTHPTRARVSKIRFYLGILRGDDNNDNSHQHRAPSKIGDPAFRKDSMNSAPTGSTRGGGGRLREPGSVRPLDAFVFFFSELNANLGRGRDGAHREVLRGNQNAEVRRWCMWENSTFRRFR